MKHKTLYTLILTLLCSICFYNINAQKKWIPLANGSSPFGAIYNLAINKNNQLYAQTDAACFGGQIVNFDTAGWSNPIVMYCDYGNIGKMQFDSFGNAYVIIAMRSPNPSYDVVYKFNNTTTLTFDTMHFTPGVYYNYYESIAVTPIGNVFAAVKYKYNDSFSHPSLYNYTTNKWTTLNGASSPLSGGGYSLIYTNNSLFGLIKNKNATKYDLGKWDGTNWTFYSTLNTGDTLKYLYKGYQNDIYATGTFLNSGNSTSRAKYNIVTNKWDGLNASASNLFADTCIKIESIIADKFGNYFGISKCKNSLGQQFVAQWNGSVWQELSGLNFNYNVSALAVDTAGNVYSVSGSQYGQYVTIYAEIVPLKLLQFNLHRENYLTKINWQTATEINTSNFNIQRSTTGKDFTTIGKVTAKGASEYTYNDPLTTEDARFKKLYYRLEIVDKDGALSYSEVRELSILNSSLSISPNPAKDKVTVSGAYLKQVKLLDNLGRIVTEKEIINSNNISIPVSHIAKGIYMIQATFKDGSVKTEKVVVE